MQMTELFLYHKNQYIKQLITNFSTSAINAAFTVGTWRNVVTDDSITDDHEFAKGKFVTVFTRF